MYIVFALQAQKLEEDRNEPRTIVHLHLIMGYFEILFRQKQQSYSSAPVRVSNAALLPFRQKIGQASQDGDISL